MIKWIFRFITFRGDREEEEEGVLNIQNASWACVFWIDVYIDNNTTISGTLGFLVN